MSKKQLSQRELKNKEFDKRLGDRLREARESLKLNQENFADYLGVDSSRYARWEQGRTSIPIFELVEIIKLFGLDTSKLLFDQEITSSFEEPKSLTGVIPFEFSVMLYGTDKDFISALESLKKTHLLVREFLRK